MREPLVIPDTGIMLRDLIAKAIYMDGHRLRRGHWEQAKAWEKQNSYKRADEAMKRGNIRNVQVKEDER